MWRDRGGPIPLFLLRWCRWKVMGMLSICHSWNPHLLHSWPRSPSSLFDQCNQWDSLPNLPRVTKPVESPARRVTKVSCSLYLCPFTAALLTLQNKLQIHHLRASNHKKNVDFPRHAVFPTLVIHPGGGHNLEKMLFCFIPQGALQTKAVIHSPPSQGVPAELHRVSSPVSLVTTKVRSLEVWDGCLLYLWTLQRRFQSWKWPPDVIPLSGHSFVFFLQVTAD